MAHLAGWQIGYYMVLTTGITTSPDFTAGDKIGTYGKSVPKVLLNSEATFEQNREIISSKKMTGNSYLTKTSLDNIDRLLGKQAPSTTFEMDFDAAAAFIPFVTLTQDATGVFVSAGTSKIFNPYTSAGVSYFAALKKVLESNKSQLIKGAIANSITINGNEGEVLTMSVDWVGADMDGNATSAATDTINKASNTAIKFSDITVEIDDTSVDISSFSVTFANNIVSRYYLSDTVSNYLLGEFTIEGSMKFPWGETNVGDKTFFDYLNNQTDFKIEIYNSATPNSVGEFVLGMNVELDSVSTSGDEEIVNEINFKGVYDGSTPIFLLQTYDGIDRTNP